MRRENMLFDAHTHLNFEEFSEEERAEKAAAIEASELVNIIDVGDNIESSKQAIADAEKYEWCYAAVGIHPQHCKMVDDEALKCIEELAAHPKVKAIGEIGLDFYYGKDDQEEQIEAFRKQIRLANKLKMPIMIHTRDANQLTMDILIEEGAFSDERKSWFPPRIVDGEEQADARVQLHCYSGSVELALEYVKKGATISLGGPITFKNGRKAAEVARAVPKEALMSETDAPYMAPEPLRGRQNRSEYVAHVVRRMSILKELDYEEMGRILTENGRRFFDIG